MPDRFGQLARIARDPDDVPGPRADQRAHAGDRIGRGLRRRGIDTGKRAAANAIGARVVAADRHGEQIVGRELARAGGQEQLILLLKTRQPRVRDVR